MYKLKEFVPKQFYVSADGNFIDGPDGLCLANMYVLSRLT